MAPQSVGTPADNNNDDEDENQDENARPPSPSRFVARQPILKADEKVIGYELLFRGGVENQFNCADPENASRSVLDSSLLMGLDLLCDGRRAFINCTRGVLLNEYMTLLPPQQTVVEILENITEDVAVLAACRTLQSSGYLIALDDFTENDPRTTLAAVADIIKVDFRLTAPQHLAGIVERYGKRSKMLAEKVETQEEFLAAKKVGFAYFQGYFFCKPQMLQASHLSPNRLNYLRMLQAASRPELNQREIEELVKGEPSICYRLLRYLNSSLFGLSAEIHSVRHALNLLGERETRRWLHLVATLAGGQNKTSALILAALVRARFCELLGLKNGQPDSDLFLMGLLSLMDAILDIPMAEILKNVSLDPACKAALLSNAGPPGVVYQLVLAQEAGDWPRAAKLARKLRVTEKQVAEEHWRAMEWARQMAGT
ncbi:MAG TPA: EAL domain-containing protein [Candidatus Acidoferrales bacterium]|jgi:EAL and modified HD-GYP domain-containing signal transduction protein|nr:EAL domain-containing protein [Candidatus Acidoferrales bacterium]